MADADEIFVTAGWPIPADLKERFTEFSRRNSTYAQDACAGALFLWMQMPAQIRAWAIKTAWGEDAVEPGFWQLLLDGLEGAMERGLSDWLVSARPIPQSTDDAVKSLGAWECMKQIASEMTESEYRVLNKTEQSLVNGLRRELEPPREEAEIARQTADDAQSREQAPRRKKAGNA
jgi:hypothetical protein